MNFQEFEDYAEEYSLQEAYNDQMIEATQFL